MKNNLTYTQILKLVGFSAMHYLRLVKAGNLHLRHDCINTSYDIHGTTYKIFRETVSTETALGENAVLVVGFHLKLIGSNAFLHWVFQRVCILTTPFWSGFPGFRVKLWMVDPVTKDYLGIYQWIDKGNAELYAESLVCILQPLSTRDSVWYRIYPNQMLTTFLHT